MLAETLSALDGFVASKSAQEVDDLFAVLDMKIRALFLREVPEIRAVLFRAKFHADNLATTSQTNHVSECVRVKLIQLIAEGDNHLLSAQHERTLQTRQAAFSRHPALMQKIAAGELRTEPEGGAGDPAAGAILDLEQADLIGCDAAGVYRLSPHGWSTLHQYEVVLADAPRILAALTKGINTKDGLLEVIGKPKDSPHFRIMAECKLIETLPDSERIKLTQEGWSFLHDRRRVLAGTRTFTLPGRPSPFAATHEAPQGDGAVRRSAGFGDVKVLDRPFFLQPDALKKLDFLDEDSGIG